MFAAAVAFALVAKEAVDRAVSFGLQDGLRLERRLFHLSFATGEFHAGMSAFLEMRANPKPA
jgi:enoyl-CoA hydratase